MLNYVTLLTLAMALPNGVPYEQIKAVFPTYMAYSSAAYCDRLWWQNNDSPLKFNCGHKCEVTNIKNTVLEELNYDRPTTGAGFVGHNPDNKEIVVVFRGTSTVQGAVTDLKFWKCDTSWKNVPGAKLHFGFLEAYNKLNEKLLAKALALANDPKFQDYQIVFTGHSLGGALATLAASDFYERNPQFGNRISLFTYGQPRVGNPAFARYINKLPFASRIYRVARRGDPVPHLPFISMGFEHTVDHYSVLENNRDTVQCQRDYDATGESSTCMNDFWETNPIKHLIYYESMSNPFNCF
ncbi:Alpha/Beta hydrolase protein [Globomyces pollinis-pini]|nr:Alpha/Beta hydrolase protein [Globomyces pollinis-pini]